MPVLVVPPVMVQVGDLLYGPDAKGPDWPMPRRVIGKPLPCAVADFRRRWPAFWRLREVRVLGYMVELHSDAGEYGDVETLHAATVRVQR